jgi:hypothetical protein
VPPVKILPEARALLLVICLPKIDLLARPKDSALSGRYIRRHRPQAQSHINRIDTERGPKGKLANPMLSGVTGGAQRNRVAIARLDPDPTIGSCTHMRSFRWCCFAAGDAGKLTDKGQVLHPPTQVRTGLAGGQGTGNARGGHWYQELSACWCLSALLVPIPRNENPTSLFKGRSPDLPGMPPLAPDFPGASAPHMWRGSFP